MQTQINSNCSFEGLLKAQSVRVNRNTAISSNSSFFFTVNAFLSSKVANDDEAIYITQLSFLHQPTLKKIHSLFHQVKMLDNRFSLHFAKLNYLNL